MTSDLTALARAAYADGWARTSGPMTGRVKAGCVAAVTLAREHADQPSVLETTLHLGSLEGTWAAVFERRGKLYTHHLAAVTTAYRALTGELDVVGGVRRLRTALGLTEAVDDPQRRRDMQAAAGVEATRIVQQTLTDPNSPEYKATVQSVADALLDAEAEGTAGATAVLAEHIGRIGVDFDLAFTDAHTALANLGEHWADAQGWLGRVVNGQATDLGNALARIAIDGGGFTDMRDAAMDVLDGEDIRAVDTLIDLAMGQSFSRGALTLYAREGVTSCDFLTAGGTRVCQICINAESGNPWALIEVPRPSLHPDCRCVLAPSTDSVLSLSANLARYVSAT